MRKKIKRFLSRPHNLLLAASAALFLQFVASVAYFYMQAVLYYEFDYLSDFAYLVYCLAAFAVLAVFVIKNRTGFAGLWFSGILLYAFAELAMFVKMLAVTYNDSIDSISNLWDNQHLYRLHICVGAVVLLYIVFYMRENKKTDLAFAGANLLVFFVFMLAVPEMGELLLEGDENVLQVAGVVFVREIAVAILAANTFALGLRKIE